MTDLDELAVQVGRELFQDRGAPPSLMRSVAAGEHDDLAPVDGFILGARAMLAKLREMGLVVEWRPIEEASREVDGHFACPCAIGSTKLGSGSHVGPIVLQATGEWEFTELDYDVFPSATHFAKLPKGPGHD